MSAIKKLQTLGNNSSLIDVLPGDLKMSILKKGIFVKNKEMFQVSSDREITVQNANFGQQGSFRVREQHSKNFVVEVTLPAGTYTLRENWALTLLDGDRIRQQIGGENEIVKHGWSNNIQTIRECDDMEVRDKYMSLTGAAITNPTVPQVAYVFLNIQTASINSGIAQYYPNYQLNQSADFLLDFNTSASIVSAGTPPTAFTKCRILYEYATVLNNSDLRPKFDSPNMKGGEQLMTHEIVSYEYALGTTGSTRRTIKLRSFPTSEIDELVFFYSNNTDIANNKYLTQPVQNIKLTMSDREIVDSQNKFHEVKQLWRDDIPCKFKVGGVEKDFYTIDLSPVNYKRSEKKSFFIQGVILSEEDLLLEFDIPADVAGRLYIYGVKKVIHFLKNGNLRRVY